MKTHAILILFCVSLYGADTTTTNIVGDITTKVSQRSGKDGKPDVRIETLYRGKTKVMTVTSRRNEQGVMAVTARGFLADGELVMAESDEDGDGTLESVAVFNPDTGNFEMFTRQSDGTVQALPSQKLESLKRQKATVDASLKELVDRPDMTTKEMGDLLENNRQKLEAIKREEKRDGD